MKISELIKSLQEARDSYGDLECFCIETDYFTESVWVSKVTDDVVNLSQDEVFIKNEGGGEWAEPELAYLFIGKRNNYD